MTFKNIIRLTHAIHHKCKESDGKYTLNLKAFTWHIGGLSNSYSMPCLCTLWKIYRQHKSTINAMVKVNSKVENLQIHEVHFDVQWSKFFKYNILEQSDNWF